MLYNVLIYKEFKTYLEFGITETTARDISSAIAVGDRDFNCEGTRMDLSYWNKFKIFDNSKMTATNKTQLTREGEKRKIMFPKNNEYEIQLLMQMGNEVTEEFKRKKKETQTEDRWKNIHSIIGTISKKKFDDGHYAEAVEAAFKEINHLIKTEYKKIKGIEEDGDTLMRKAFTQNNPPVFKLADLSTENGKNIQQGYMDIFAGSMKGIRNPKAHLNMVVDPDEAWEMIVLASHLMRMWDKRII